ncbi:eukaryotic peptide chain release factor GTP-binding subunit ERF3B-like isoform 1 [Aphelenchoides avenae]|nr:eukaryotic peptide chain release factor GTP-binding subunit ERF3B-like isoform 1 [Aphelenchus avenae]
MGLSCAPGGVYGSAGGYGAATPCVASPTVIEQPLPVQTIREVPVQTIREVPVSYGASYGGYAAAPCVVPSSPSISYQVPAGYQVPVAVPGYVSGISGGGYSGGGYVVAQPVAAGTTIHGGVRRITLSPHAYEKRSESGSSSSGSKSELPVDLYDDSIPLETEKFTGNDITKEESKRFSDFNVYKRRYAYLSKLKERRRKQFSAKALDEATPLGSSCNNYKLARVISKAIVSDISISKRLVRKATELAFAGKKFDVICATGEFSYSIYAEHYYPRPATMSGQHPQQPPRQGGGGSFNPNAASFVPNLNAPAFVPGQHFQPGGYYQQPPPGGFYNPQMAPPPNMYAPPPPHMMPHQQYYHPAPPMSDAQEQRQQQMFAGQAQPQQQHAQPPIESWDDGADEISVPAVDEPQAAPPQTVPEPPKPEEKKAEQPPPPKVDPPPKESSVPPKAEKSESSSKTDQRAYEILMKEAIEKFKSTAVIDENRKEHVNIVFIGHVDAGKSTIGGQLMYLTGMVDKRTLEKYEREAKEKGRESWYLSWALDTNDEEREKGKTVEVGRAFFETEAKHFTILDAPGHKSFVPNMISGATQADLAVLVISARKGEFETGFDRGGQTREHAMLVKTAGVKHLIILVNKMDDPTVEWDEERWKEIQQKLTPYLRKCGFNPKTDITYIPCSGLTGAFLKDRPEAPTGSWYTGPCFLEYVDNMLPKISRDFSGPVRAIIADKYSDMGTVVIGKLEAGVIVKGQPLLLMPNRTGVQVVQCFSDEEELKLKGVEEADILSGFVVCSPEVPCRVGKIFDAEVLILEHKSIITSGYSCVLHIHAAVEEVTVKAIICTIDKKTGEKKKSRFVKQDDKCIMRFESAEAFCLDVFKDFPQMGRFTLRDEGRTIAIGKVVKVVE